MAAVRNQTLARKIGQVFANAIRNEPAVLHLWVRPVRDYVELWALIRPADAETDAENELRIFAQSAVLYNRFPEADIRVHIFNPRMYEGFILDEALPSGSEEIPLRSE